MITYLVVLLMIFQSHKYSCYMSDFEKRIYPLIDHIKLAKYQRSILKKRFAK